MIVKFVITLIRGLWPYILREFLIALFRLLLFPLIKKLLFSRRNPPSIFGSRESWFNCFRRRWYNLVNGPRLSFVRRLFFNAPTRRTTRCVAMATADPRRPTHMQLQSPLFRLPREIRDQIYDHCLVCEAGLEYDYSKNKLTRTNGERIDLSLMYTCREAAAELQGVALRRNKVIFRAASPKALRYNLGMFGTALDEMNWEKDRLLDKMAQSCLTDKTEAFISLVYPQFAPVLQWWRLGGRIVPWRNDTLGEPPSVYRDFVHFTLRVLEGSPHFSMPFNLLGLPHLEPWQIPDDEALEEVLSITYARSTRPRLSEGYECTVSAASCAIRFLSSLPTSIRPELRQVDLIEDRPSISYPECHTRGLIPFCQENEKLRIRRRVDLWWNALYSRRSNRHYIFSEIISQAVARWMVEAMALPVLGMPSKAFKMTFEDSGSTPDEFGKIFDVLQREVAWQVAEDLSYERQRLPSPTWTERRLRQGYTYEAFPQILKDLASHDSIIHCDALPANTHDPEKIVNGFAGESATDWQEYRRTHHTQSFIDFPTNRPLWCP